MMKTFNLTAAVFRLPFFSIHFIRLKRMICRTPADHETGVLKFTDVYLSQCRDGYLHNVSPWLSVKFFNSGVSNRP